MIPAVVAHSENIDVYTPAHIFEELGVQFDLDPCAPKDWCPSKDWCSRVYTVEDDGLAQPWDGLVWLNPPYQRVEIGKWVKKLAEHENGIALVYVRTDTAWFQDNPPDALLLLRGRVRFIERAKGSKTVSGASPSMLMGYGARGCEALRNAKLPGQFFYGLPNG